MDSDKEMYWPKVGDVVHCTGSGSVEADTFVVMDKINEYPCSVYIIRSRLNGSSTRAFRHQLTKGSMLPSHSMREQGVEMPV